LGIGGFSIYLVNSCPDDDGTGRLSADSPPGHHHTLMTDTKHIQQEQVKLERDYLLIRSIESSAHASQVLEQLRNVIEKLSKAITPTTLPQLLTVAEVSRLFKVSQRTVRDWVDNRQIPFQKIAGTVRFRLDELLACGRADADTGFRGPRRSSQSETASAASAGPQSSLEELQDNVVRLPRSRRLQPRKEQKHAS
jgi:excisionase family DNA binding protein